MWNLEGLRVSAVYMEEFPIVGQVVLSRVALGGRVKHTVVLDEPIEVYGNLRYRVLIDHQTVARVQSNWGNIMSRKTVCVQQIKSYANGILASENANGQDLRLGAILMIEQILLGSGNYKGFRYLDIEGTEIGDDTRRFYFWG
jgi:hypothetical protein